MRSITLYLSIVLAQCLWVSGGVSAADMSSSLRTNFGMTIIATDLAVYELPSTSGRATQVPSVSAFSPVSVPKPLPGLWHESVVAGASMCSLLGANWCLALQGDSPAPAVLGVSHSADETVVLAPTDSR
jgi:hypothetical protein